MAVLGGCGAPHSAALRLLGRRRPAAGPPAQPAVPPLRASGSADAPAIARLERRGLPVFCGGRRRYAALTFDDGPGVYTHLAVRMLRSAHLPATFFLVARNLARYPGWARREARSGAVEDHTETHPVLTELDAALVRQEIGGAQREIEAAARAPVRLFRPPYGAHDSLVDSIAHRLGLLEVLWSTDSGDSLGANYRQIASNVKAGLRPGAIILMHENRGQTIRALRSLILPHLRRAHLRLVTVPRLLAVDPPSLGEQRAGLAGCLRGRQAFGRPPRTGRRLKRPL
jgi:peptidoglycan/xylan/chitin deacetylase (PgdA/CDA1 family)